jgi:hypothetical protein
MPFADGPEAFFKHAHLPSLPQVASKMAAFPPRDLVMAAPVFSRCLYAQLALQEYAPPRSYPMPMPTDPEASKALQSNVQLWKLIAALWWLAGWLHTPCACTLNE